MPLCRSRLIHHVSGGKTKIYDTPDMEGYLYNLIGSIETGDTVNVSGIGTYRDSSGNTNKDVEVTDDSTISTTTYNNGDTTITIRDFTITDKAYSIENVVLSGADASNYLLTSNLITGTDGRITQRPIHYLPTQEIYDGDSNMENTPTRKHLLNPTSD